MKKKKLELKVDKKRKRKKIEFRVYDKNREMIGDIANLNDNIPKRCFHPNKCTTSSSVIFIFLYTHLFNQ